MAWEPLLRPEFSFLFSRCSVWIPLFTWDCCYPQSKISCGVGHVSPNLANHPLLILSCSWKLGQGPFSLQTFTANHSGNNKNNKLEDIWELRNCLSPYIPFFLHHISSPPCLDDHIQGNTVDLIFTSSLSGGVHTFSVYFSWHLCKFLALRWPFPSCRLEVTIKMWKGILSTQVGNLHLWGYRD